MPQPRMSSRINIKIARMILRAIGIMCRQRPVQSPTSKVQGPLDISSKLSLEVGPWTLDFGRLFWKVLSPALVDQRRNVVAYRQLIGQTRFLARIDHNRKCISKMMPNDLHAGGVDISGRFESRPGRPKEIRRRSGHPRIIMQNYEWPVTQNSFIC